MLKRNHNGEEANVEERRMSGKIVRLNSAKGFGFIEGEDNRDYFFHWTELDKFSRVFKSLKKDDPVEFNPGSTSQGLRAYSVRTLT